MRNAAGKLNQDNQQHGPLLNSLMLLHLLWTERREIQNTQNHKIRSCMKMSRDLFSISPNLTTRCASMNLEGVQLEAIKKW